MTYFAGRESEVLQEVREMYRKRRFVRMKFPEILNWPC